MALGEICTKIGTGATPRGGSASYLSRRDRYALVRSQNVFDRHFSHTGLAFITDGQADGLKGAELRRDDILLNITGDGVTFGRACVVPQDVLPACVNQHVSIVRVDPQRAHVGYVLAFLTHPSVKAYIESFNAGGSRRAITKSHIESFRLPLPPLDEQRLVAAILGALDDKIELNRRHAERLDRTARAIFHGWFIANPAAASWPIASVGDLFDVNPSRPLLRMAPAPYLDMANMPISGPSAFAVATRIPGSGARFENGDTLLARITPCLENGKTALVDFLAPGERGWGSTEYIVLRPREPLPEPFAYCLARQSDFVSYAVARMNGSSGRQRVSAAAIGEFEMRSPPPELATRFGLVVGPMFTRITLAAAESRTLAQTRDALLPRLLSGDFEVAA